MRSRSSPSNKATVDLALLILRIILGATFTLHGSQKLFGAFGGSGLTGFTGMVAGMGLQPARVFAILGACSEFFGGLLVFLGIATELGAMAILATMGVAIWKVTGPNGFFATRNGYEYNAVLIAVCVALILAGPGRWAIWRMGRR